MQDQRTIRFNNICEEVSKCQTIPLHHQPNFEEALVILCQSFSRRQPRSENGPRQFKELRAHHTRKKANAVYLSILEYSPQLFVPFVLTFSPKLCETFDAAKFHQQHLTRTTQNFNAASREYLESVGQKYKIGGHPHFKRLILALFPERGPLIRSSPITGAEGDEHWAYDAVNPQTIGTIFGSRISELNACSAPREHETAHNHLSVTQTVRARLPRKNFQDGVIWIDIGHADSFARTLFPRSALLADLASASNGHERPDGDVDVLQSSTATSGTSEEDLLSFEGAAEFATVSIFLSRTLHGIETSQLRMWEKENGRFDTTNCVTMTVSRKQPQRGTVRLRIGFIECVAISKILYAYDSEIH